MSIIEKAAKRMDEKRKAAQPHAQPAAYQPGNGRSGASGARGGGSACARSGGGPARASPGGPVARTASGHQAGRTGPEPHARHGHGHRHAMGCTTLVEDFRIIKRPLIKRAFAARTPGDKPGNLIMITSSLPGEGKTYCAINLAMSIAMELDHTVLLVDADVARPSVLRVLGLPSPARPDGHPARR
ncbi:hypothetical protein LP420_19040 [Massilia sp. B-10]|nr:hypothetical protein LP420_19040 [Massilia sp. B-10]